MVEHSIVVRDIRNHPQLASRVEALVREFFWQSEELNPNQWVPVDDLMWCIASYEPIQLFVKQAMAESDRPTATEPSVIKIPDEMLKFVVLMVGWPRLHPSEEEPPNGDNGVLDTPDNGDVSSEDVTEGESA